MNDRSKEKVMAFVVLGIFAGISLVALAVGLSLRKGGGKDGNPNLIGVPSSFLPISTTSIPPGETPFSNPRIAAMKKTPEEKYAMFFEFVRRNQWWRKRPTKEELAEVVVKGTQIGRGGVIWATRDGKFAFQTREECPDPYKATFPGHPELRSDQYLHAQTGDFEDADKHSVISSLVTSVDAASRRTEWD